MNYLTGFFFFLVFLAGCISQQEQKEIAIIWEDDQAIAFSIPSSLLQNLNAENVSNEFTVRLERDNSSSGIFGEFNFENDKLIFKPLIPFSRGLTYTLLFKESQIGLVEIPGVDFSDLPSVFNIYPSADTLPENLLKLYIAFSKPMREGEALRQITMLNEQDDTVAAPFMDLKPEMTKKRRRLKPIVLIDSLSIHIKF